MSTSVVTARLSEEELTALDKLAAAMDRSRAWIVSKAIDRYVREEMELLAIIQVGIDDIEAGRFKTQEDVEMIFGVRRGKRHAA